MVISLRWMPYFLFSAHFLIPTLAAIDEISLSKEEEYHGSVQFSFQLSIRV